MVRTPYFDAYETLKNIPRKYRPGAIWVTKYIGSTVCTKFKVISCNSVYGGTRMIIEILESPSWPHVIGRRNEYYISDIESYYTPL